jgi:MFS family permease
VGVLLVALFVLLVHEDDSRGMVFPEELNIGKVLRKLVFSPRRYPDYAWNWLGRFFFYFGLTLNTTFTAFFFASKLGVDVSDVAGVIAILSLGSIAAVTLGALGGGFLSDRLHRRRVFVLASGLIFGAGAIVMAFAGDLPTLVGGSLLGSLGIGMFSAVDQALLLDVLPERDTDAGRFMSITGFATSIPQAVAPLIAPLFLPHRRQRRGREELPAPLCHRRGLHRLRWSRRALYPLRPLTAGSLLVTIDRPDRSTTPVPLHRCRRRIRLRRAPRRLERDARLWGMNAVRTP